MCSFLDRALSNALQWLGTSEVKLKLEQRSTDQVWKVTTVYWEIFAVKFILQLSVTAKIKCMNCFQQQIKTAPYAKFHEASLVNE